MDFCKKSYSLIYLFSLSLIYLFPLITTLTLFAEPSPEGQSSIMESFQTEETANLTQKDLSSSFESEPCATTSPCSDSCCYTPDCSPFFYIGHTEGRWLDNNQGYTTLGIFSTFDNFNKHQLFTFIDIRGHYFNNGRAAANLGIGLRKLINQTQTVIGINTFYDFRKASWNHSYQQIGAGIEIFTPCFELRINTYIPVGQTTGHSSTHIFDQYIGNYIATCRQQRSAMLGGDIEIGKWLLNKTPCNCIALFGAIGFYHYSSKEHHQPKIYGAEARLETLLGNYFTLEAKGGYDQVYHGAGQITLAFNLPFDCLFPSTKTTCCSCQTNNEQLCQKVQRQEIIAIDKKRCCWSWNWGGQCQNCSN